MIIEYTLQYTNNRLLEKILWHDLGEYNMRVRSIMLCQEELLRRKSSQAELFHKKIYDALNISSQPGKMVKTIL